MRRFLGKCNRDLAARDALSKHVAEPADTIVGGAYHARSRI
jgi:hypothetical protein